MLEIAADKFHDLKWCRTPAGTSLLFVTENNLVVLDFDDPAVSNSHFGNIENSGDSILIKERIEVDFYRAGGSCIEEVLYPAHWEKQKVIKIALWRYMETENIVKVRNYPA